MSCVVWPTHKKLKYLQFSLIENKEPDPHINPNDYLIIRIVSSFLLIELFDLIRRHSWICALVVDLTDPKSVHETLEL